MYLDEFPYFEIFKPGVDHIKAVFSELDDSSAPAKLKYIDERKYHYNPEGYLFVIEEYTKSNDSAPKVYRTIRFNYKSNNRLSERLFYRPSGSLQGKAKYFYSEFNRIVRIEHWDPEANKSDEGKIVLVSGIIYNHNFTELVETNVVIGSENGLTLKFKMDPTGLIQ